MEKVQILLWSVSKNVIIFSVFINKFSSAKLCHCLFFHKSFETLFDFIWLYMFMYVLMAGLFYYSMFLHKTS